MKHLFLLILTVFFSVAQAATIPLFSAGDYIFAGVAYIDNDSQNDGTFSQAAGVGNITEIRNSDGTLFWDNSTEDLNMAFSGFSRNTLAPGLGGTTQFSSDGGFVDFYSNALGTFQATGDHAADTLAISGGLLRLAMQGVLDSFGNSAVGQFSPTSYSSNGQLDVVGGTWLNIFDTDSIVLADGTIASATFNLSGDNIATGGYDFSGSADLATHAVPAPGALLLMVVGLGFGFGFVKRRTPVEFSGYAE